MFGIFRERKPRQVPCIQEPTVIAAPSENRAKQCAEAAPAIGPILKSGLSIKPMLALEDESEMAYRTGARVLCGGREVFAVNEAGRQLLEMADGTVPIAEMIARLELGERAAEVGMFFVKLGRAGYLENRVEIELYETKSCEEGCL